MYVHVFMLDSKKKNSGTVLHFSDNQMFKNVMYLFLWRSWQVMTVANTPAPATFCWNTSMSLLLFSRFFWATSLSVRLLPCPAWGHRLLWSHKNVGWPIITSPLLCPNVSTCLTLIPHLPTRPTRLKTQHLWTPPPSLPSLHADFFTPPSFGRTPDALTQSQLFAWEGVPHSPSFADLCVQMRMCISEQLR